MAASTKKPKTKKPAAKKTKKANKKGEATKQTLARAAKKAKEAAAKEVPTSIVFTDEEMAPVQKIDKELITIRLSLSRSLELYRKQETTFLGQLDTKNEEAKELTDKLVRERIGDALDEYKWNLDLATNTLSRLAE